MNLSNTAIQAALAENLRAQLIDCGRDFWRRGWSLATSSNYSAVLSRDPLRLIITASGFDKGALTHEQFVVVGDDGKLVEPGELRPSAETLLHVAAALELEAGAILHTHSVGATRLSDRGLRDGGVAFEGYEMLKALSGVSTHKHSEWLPVYPNTQDMAALARDVQACWREGRGLHGFLIHRHGLYTWGKDIAEARRQIEAWEWLFEAAQ